MWRLGIALSLAACVKSSSLQCEVGTEHERTCPGSNVCDDVHHLCVEAGQLNSCIGMPDRAECMAGMQAGFCDLEVCLPLTCGDGVAIGGEPCDGNDFHGETCMDHGFYTTTPLTCSASCLIVTDQCVGTCGDGIVQSEHELCDGNDPSVSCTDFGYGTGALSCLRCGPGFDACKYFGWHKPVFTMGTMNDVDATSDTNVWAVGVGAQVYHFDGADWRTFDLAACSVAPASALFGVDVVGDNDVWISGRDETSHGLVVHIAGSSCTSYATANTPVTFTDIAVSGTNDVWLAASLGVMRFDGQTFSQSDSTSVFRISAAGPTDVYAHGNGGLAVRHWDGTSWTTLSIAGSPNVYTIDGTSATDLYVGGNNNGAAALLHWDGATWTPVLPAVLTSTNVTSIRHVESRLFIGTTGTGGTGVYEYDGAGWTSLNGPLASGTMVVAATPTGHLYGIGSSASQLFRYDGTAVSDQSAPPGQVIRALALQQDLAFAVLQGTNDLYVWNGVTWTKDNGVTGVSDVATDGAGSIYVIGTGGLRSRPIGSLTWTTLDSTARGSRLWVVSAGDIWLLDAATKKTLLHFNGTTTDATPCATCTSPAMVNDVWGAGNDIFAVRNDDQVMHWNGSAWTTTTVAPQLVALYGWAPNDVVAIAGSSGAIYHYDGSSWTMATSAGLFASTIWGTSDADLFVGNSQGAVERFDGARWSPVDVATQGIKAITGAGDSVFFFDTASSSSHRIVRTTRW